MNIVTFMIAFLEILVLVFYTLYSSYSIQEDEVYKTTDILNVLIMDLVGFGFLMTFPRFYGYSAIMHSILCTVLCIQTYPLIQALWRLETPIVIDTEMILLALFSGASVLIAEGAILGKTTIAQTVFFTISFTLAYAANEYVGELLHAQDVGGSMTIHTFGAFFGIMCSLFLHKPKEIVHSASYESNIFSLLGTLVLFVFWPSFNSAYASPEIRTTAFINTILGLTGSTLSTVYISILLRGKLGILEIQNAILSGGVVMGAACAMEIHPAVAIASGLLVGIVSTIGFIKVSPITGVYLHDTCGVLFLHGIPGLFGGVIGAIASMYTEGLDPINQMKYLGVTLAISISAGGFTGWLLYHCFTPAVREHFFNDLENFKDS
jgi:ammonium transporter Rh